MRVFLLGLLLSCCPLLWAQPSPSAPQAPGGTVRRGTVECGDSAGQYCYYDGMWYLMGLLHCSGKYQVWTPKWAGR